MRIRFLVFLFFGFSFGVKLIRLFIRFIGFFRDTSPGNPVPLLSACLLLTLA